MKRITLALTTMMVLGGSVLFAVPLEPEFQPRPFARLVSFDELQNRLSDPNLRLLDARSRADYDKAHIPRSVWVDVKAAQKLGAKPGGLSDEDAWKAWSTPLAISPTSEVLVYDGDRQLDAARTWWLITYLGVRNVGLINGNFPLWVQQGRPVTTVVPKIEPQPFPVSFLADRYATRSDVLEAIKGNTTQVIDARSDEEYTGEKAVSKRGGHIPTACHLEWSDLVDKDGRFLDEDVLRSKLKKFALNPGQPVITHCQSGGRASVDAFVLERLGFPAKNYYLGWSDWGNAEDTPVVAGKEKNKK